LLRPVLPGHRERRGGGRRRRLRLGLGDRRLLRRRLERGVGLEDARGRPRPGRLLLLQAALEAGDDAAHLAARRRVGQLAEEGAVGEDGAGLVAELALALADVEEEARVLEGAVGLPEGGERLLELAQVVVLGGAAE